MSAVIKTSKPRQNFPDLLNTYAAEIARALPKHLSAERMVRVALSAYRLQPKLADCHPQSVFAAVIQAAQLGLELGMGEAYLVPFKRECQLISGYQGLMKLARNTGQVQDFYAYEVRANDAFEVVLGLERNLYHEPLKEHGFPASDEQRGPIVGFYAVAVLKDGSRSFQAMSRAQVEAVRDHALGYQAAKANHKESLWDTDFLSMGLKTVIRRLCKYLPRSPELATALLLDTLAEQGKAQPLTLEGTWNGVDGVGEGDTNGSKKPLPGENPEGETTLSPENQVLIERIQGATSRRELEPLRVRVATIEGEERTAVVEAWKAKEWVISAAEPEGNAAETAPGS